MPLKNGKTPRLNVRLPVRLNFLNVLPLANILSFLEYQLLHLFIWMC